VGYQPSNQNETTGTSNLPVGVLPVDAIFNPIRKVDYAIERTRVGQVTDYERLVLEVWTDGTIAPLDAVHLAADTLVKHFYPFSTITRRQDTAQERPAMPVPVEIYQTPIEQLELSPRTLNCLKRAHITKVGEVLEMSDDDLLKIRNFGDKSLEELHRRLAEWGLGPLAGQKVEGDGGLLNDELPGSALDAMIGVAASTEKPDLEPDIIGGSRSIEKEEP